MAAVYTIRIIDQASASVNRVNTALARVAVTTAATAQAMSRGSKMEQMFARDAERLARAHLRAAQAIQRAGKAQDALSRKRLPRALGGEGRGAGGLLGGAGGAAAQAAAVAALGVAAMHMGRGFLEAAGNAQDLKRTFERIAPGEFEAFRAEVQRLGLDLDAGMQSALRLRTSFESFDAMKMLQFAKAAGLSADQVSRMTTALSQIKGRGVLQAEELNQWLEAVPGADRGKIVDAIASELKIGRDEAFKRLNSGKLSADVGIRALMFGSMASLKLGGADFKGLESAIAEASGGINSKLTVLDNSITKIKENLGQAIVASGFLDYLVKVSTTAEGATSKIDRLANAFTQLGNVFKIFNGDTSVPASGVFGVSPNSTAGKVLDYTPNKFFSGLWESITGGRKDPYSPASLDIPDIAASGVDGGADLALSAAESMADGAIAEAEMAQATGGGVSTAQIASVAGAAGAALSGGGGGGSGAVVNVGGVTIQIDGAQGASATVDAIRDFFIEGEFAALLDRMAEGSGA